MLPGQASRSLVRVAIRRAAHQLLDTPLIIRDPVAVGLVPEASEQSIFANVEEHRTPIHTIYRAGFALRSRFTEDRLREAGARGVGQYVIVGAGLDTFPWRQPAFAEAMDIFYVDHPTSLAWTRTRICERGLATPSNLTYVGADLEKRELAERLSDLGFNHESKAFFSVLGVTQYIGREALGHLFGLAASLPAGSEIVFSSVPPDDQLEGEDLTAAVAAVALSSNFGEPWITRMKALEVIEDLRTLGFSNVLHMTPERANALYFSDRSDGLKAPAVEQLIAAIV